MIPDEQVARIRHLFHAEHWKIGTIAAELHLHPDTVRRALETDRFCRQPRLRARLTDPYLDFLRQQAREARAEQARYLERAGDRAYLAMHAPLAPLLAVLVLLLAYGFLRFLAHTV